MASEAIQSAAPVHRFILLTDIAQSSRLAEQYGRDYLAALERHNALVETAVAARGGEVYKQTGDGYLVLFETAGACLNAALELGELLSKLEPLAEDEPLQVRLALHAGTLQPSGKEYFGPALNRISRICQVCNPGQVLLSNAIKAVLPNSLDSVALLDLGQHHLRDLAEPEHLYQLDSRRLSRHEFPPLATLDNRPNNLVEQPNTFIGRERELRELAELLLSGKRLVSIMAPGGYGKSRLAAQLCANLLHRFDNGVFMVYLAPVRESLDVPTAVSGALGYQFSGNREPQDQLSDYLRTKDLLLCMDNFEHLLDSAPLVTELLRAAPNLKIIITSREPLRIQGEQTYLLEPLPIDARGGQYSEAELLFADRAALVNRGFALTPENRAEVGHFCEHLAGIPLALELAAAWMDNFTLRELHDELTDQLELAARASDLDPRHHSLKASLDWSWNLLGKSQQEILMRLSAFRGGFFSEAAAAVLNMKGMSLRAALSRLADKSWLYTREVDGHTRFLLRDMLAHEYVFAKLDDTRGADDSMFEGAIRAHAQYFAGLAEREGPRLKGGGTPDEGAAQRAALRSWRTELENIYEALDTATARDELKWLLPLARYLFLFLKTAGEIFPIHERYRLLLKAAERTGDRALQAICLHALSYVQYRRAEFSAARDLCNRSLELSREVSDPKLEANALASLASLHLTNGEYQQAREVHCQVLKQYRESGDRWGEANALAGLGSIHFILSEETQATELRSAELEIRCEIGDRSGQAGAVASLASIKYSNGEYLQAVGLLDQALAIIREVGDQRLEALFATNLANACYSQGLLSDAADLLSQALAIRLEKGLRIGLCYSLASSGFVLDSGGEPAAAWQCLFGSLHHAAKLGLTLEHSDMPLFEQKLASLEDPETGLPLAEHESFRKQTEELSLEHLAEFAIAELAKLRVALQADSSGQVGAAEASGA